MTIYYTMTFMLLAAEMATFCVLVAPMPYTLKKKLFTFLSTSAVVAKIAYGLKISFIFVGVLFVDALQRMFRATADADMAKQGTNGAADVRTETNLAARKFYSQRNTYLTGFCLFLSLVLTRTFYIVLDLLHTQEEYAKLKQTSASNSRTSGAAGNDVEVLKKQLAAAEAKNRDFDVLKKQAASQAQEYDALSTRYNNATGQKSSDKRRD
ncbi:endoplasmic reticulum protein [Pterulicium gracile]|uniref:Endoplasmic reticulum transmembrane protein n=1 Tax=Pterulicium gracile TaxID=1884261 RepID=A0A5C3Q5Y7_9AGAR|nr:endoplasmic reticulum protein [Pterula gracilis]